MPVPRQFSPDTDIRNLEGKVIFVTGGTAGLGFESVLHLARHNPRHIFFSGRNQKAADALLERVKSNLPNVSLTFVECDLTSLRSVTEASAKFLTRSDRLDILMCNAGIMAHPPSLTADGYEAQFGTNHLGHALLIKKLTPLLLSTASTPDSDVRIIIMTSLGFRLHPRAGIAFESLKTTQDFGFGGPWRRYGQSKLANLLHARELARHYPQITTVAIHPGIVKTDLVHNLKFSQKLLVYAAHSGTMVKAEEGAYNQLWAASTDRKNIHNGQFYEPVGVLSSKLDNTAKDEKLAHKLWDWTEEQLEAY